MSDAILTPGWFQRQADAAVAAVTTWPDWKKREAGIDHLFPSRADLAMTIKECWAHIAACTRAENWDGVAARARELATLGETADADGLLWAVTSGCVPKTCCQTFRGWPPRPNEDHRVWWSFVLRGPDGRVETSWATPYCESWAGTPDADIIKGWEWLIATRAHRIKYYGGLVTVPAAPVVA